MIEAVVNIGEFLLSLLDLLFSIFGFLGSSLLNGVNFFISTLTNLPLFLLDLFNELPPFYKVGISGVFGLLLLVVFLKIVSLVR